MAAAPKSGHTAVRVVSSAPDAKGRIISRAASDLGLQTRRPRLRGWLHAAVVPIAMAGGWWLIARTPGADPWSRGSVGVFALFMVGLYTTSSLYHVPSWGTRVRQVLARIDGAMIQLFIAASFTPIAYHALSGRWRTWSLVLAWTVAVVGATIAASPLQAPRWLGTAGYIAAGWLLAVPFTRVMLNLPAQASVLIVLGAVLYTIGGIIYARQRPDPFPRWFGYHEIFHVLVIGGSCAHYVAIWQYVLPT